MYHNAKTNEDVCFKWNKVCFPKPEMFSSNTKTFRGFTTLLVPSLHVRSLLPLHILLLSLLSVGRPFVCPLQWRHHHLGRGHQKIVSFTRIRWLIQYYTFGIARISGLHWKPLNQTLLERKFTMEINLWGFVEFFLSYFIINNEHVSGRKNPFTRREGGLCEGHGKEKSFGRRL